MFGERHATKLIMKSDGIAGKMQKLNWLLTRGIKTFWSYPLVLVSPVSPLLANPGNNPGFEKSVFQISSCYDHGYQSLTGAAAPF